MAKLDAQKPHDLTLEEEAIIEKFDERIKILFTKIAVLQEQHKMIGAEADPNKPDFRWNEDRLWRVSHA